MTEPITLEAFLSAVKLYEMSEHINPTQPNGKMKCVYTDANGNHCIFGQVMVDLGLTCEDGWEGYTADHLILDQLKPRFDDPAAVSLIAQRIQVSADIGSTWGRAIAGVIRVLEAGTTSPEEERVLSVWRSLSRG